MTGKDGASAGADGSSGTPIDPQSDGDGDGVLARVDNCPSVANPDQLDLDGDGAGDACDSDTAVCASGGAAAERRRGNLYFVLDWSRSMDDKDGDDRGPTRWERVIEALDAVSSSTASDFNVGVAIYPDPSAALANNRRVCERPKEVLALGNYASNLGAFTGSYAAFDTPTVGTHTPTALALRTVLSRLGATFAADPGSDAVVLLTDGQPNSASAPSSCSTDGDESGALSAATALAAAGVKLYVVGMAINTDHLQDMANRGTPGWTASSPPQPYYTATLASELSAAFDAIRNDAVVCSFSVTATGTGNANFDRMRVVLDRDGNAATVANDSLLSGSAYVREGTLITLSDSACNAFRAAVAQNAAAQVRVVVPCAQSVATPDGGVPACIPATEACDGVDNDCDGQVDEGCAEEIFI